MKRTGLIRRAAALAATAAVIAGCSGSGDGGSTATTTTTTAASTTSTTAVPARLTHADASGSWTIGVYMAADNNLEASAIEDLVEMTEATGTDFVVLIDRAPGYAEDDLGLGLGNFEDTALLHIRDGEAEVLDTPGELNMGDPTVLQQFITGTITDYPNDHQGLVLWDHGGSWSGVAWDDTDGGDNITVAEMTEAIEAGLADTDVEALDLVGFDACLMSTLEVADGLAPHAAYLLASEELEPGYGWDWSALSADGGATTTELAGSVIDAYQAVSDEAGEAGVTLSLVDLTKLGAVDAAAETLAATLDGDAAEVIGQIGRIRAATTGFGRDPNPDLDYHLVDLGDLAAGLGEVDATGDAAAQLAAAIDEVVVDHTSGTAAGASTGLAAYFPPTAELRDPDYADAADSGPWAQVIDAFYGTAADLGDEGVPLYVDEDRYIEEGSGVVVDHSGVAMEAEVEAGGGGNVAETVFHWGRVPEDDTDHVIWFGGRNGTVEGDTIAADYDWSYLVVDDGATQAIVFADVHFDADGEVDRIIVPFVFQRPGDEQTDGQLHLGFDGGSITAETFYLRTDEGIAAFTPGPGDAFVPYLKEQDLTDQSVEWIPGSVSALDASAELTYRFTTLPGATPIMFGLGFTGVGGVTDFVYHGTATPYDLGE